MCELGFSERSALWEVPMRRGMWYLGALAHRQGKIVSEGERVRVDRLIDMAERGLLPLGRLTP